MRAMRLFVAMEALLVVIVACMLMMALQPLWEAPGEGQGVRGRGMAGASLGPSVMAPGLLPDRKGFRSRTGRLFLVGPNLR